MKFNKDQLYAWLLFGPWVFLGWFFTVIIVANLAYDFIMMFLGE